jgi:hypothetical protein
MASSSVKIKIEMDTSKIVNSCKEATKALNELAEGFEKLQPKRWWQFWK